MKKMICVIGSSEASGKLYQLAEDIGTEISKRGCVLVVGGPWGVMGVASRGAKSEGGIVVAVLPSKEKEGVEFVDIPIATGVGRARSDIMINSSDGIIVIGGEAGTLREIALAYKEGKPIVVLKGSGGWADKVADSYLDTRKTVRIMGATSAKQAVDLIIKQISK